MADESATSQCENGKHYLFDDSAKKFVNVGPCEDLHDEEGNPSPKMQVINAAQQAGQAAKGQPQTGLLGSPDDAAAAAAAKGASSSGFQYMQNPLKGL